MRPRTALILLMTALPAGAAISNVGVKETTSTQAILRYTAPTGSGCTVEVYDSTGMKGGGLRVTDASNAAPIRITTHYDHYLTTGDRVYLSGVEGNTAANGYWTVTVTGNTTFTLNSSTGNGAFTKGGTVAILVHDVNPRLFPGANLDNRPGSLKQGRERIFVAGKRAAEKATDNRWYSRALQADTAHSYRIVCGADTATGPFQTTNLPLGGTYYDAWPADSDAPNQMAWPSIDWSRPSSAGLAPLSSSGTTVTSTGHGLVVNDLVLLTSGSQRGEVRKVTSITNANTFQIDSAFPGTQTNRSWVRLDPTRRVNAQSIVDPQSGLLLHRMTALRLGTPSFSAVAVREAWGSGWAPGAALTDALSASGGAAATYTGDGTSTPPWMTATSSRVNPSYDIGHADNGASTGAGMFNLPSSVVVNLTGSATTTGANGSVDVCLSIDGVNCLSRVVTQDLSACGTSCTIGSSLPVFAFWEDPADPLKVQVGRKDLFGRTGNATYDPATRSLTVINTAQQYFNVKWTSGSRITFDGISYEIERVVSPKMLILKDQSALPPAATTAAYTASNFSVLVRKTTNSTHTVNVDWVTFDYYTYPSIGWFAAGYDACHPTPVQQTYNGVTRSGYHCLLPGEGINELWFVDREMGDAVYLTRTTIAAGSDKGRSWPAGPCLISFPIFHPTDPNTTYCVVNMDGGGQGVLALTYTAGDSGNTEQPFESNSTRWSQHLINAGGKSIETLVSEFLAANDPTGPVFKGSCIFGSTDGLYAGFRCNWGGQDTYGWGVTIDVRPGPTEGQVVGARATHAYFPFRYCVLHGYAASWNALAGSVIGSNTMNNPFQGNTACGGGPWVTEISGTLPLPPTGDVTCPANPFGTAARAAKKGLGESVCSTVTVTGDVYDSTPCSNPTFDNNNSQRGDLGPIPMQGVRLGDVFCHGADCVSAGGPRREYMQVLAIDGNTWTVLRGVYLSTPAEGVNNETLRGFCSVATHPIAGGNASSGWVDVLANPTGKLGLVGFYPMNQGHSTGQKFFRRVAEGYPNHPVQEGTPAQMSQQYDNNTFRYLSYLVQFAGRTGILGSDTHPSTPAATREIGDWHLDFTPLYNEPYASSLPITSLGTSGVLFRVAPTATAFHRKFYPTFAYCGNKPLVEVSGPGSQISESASDAGKFCVIDLNPASECKDPGGTAWGTAAGQVVLNCPGLTNTSTMCGNNGYFEGSNDSVRPCVGSAMARLETTYQMGFRDTGNEKNGNWSRTLSRLLIAPQRSNSPFANTVGLPDATWALGYTPNAGGVQNVMLGVKLPRYPADHSLNRATFLPTPVEIKQLPPAAATAVVRFGYTPEYYCTSRKEACISTTTGTAINESTPFYWASEANAGVVCSSGCSILIPALSQRILYYQVVYRNAGGTEVGASPPNVVATP